MPWPPCPYEVDENWEQMLHEFTGSPWPCPVSDDFWELWSRVMGSYSATRLCENHGSMSRRVQVWIGGSQSIGGTGTAKPPGVRSSSGGGTTLTFRELKCSMSCAMAATSS